MRLFTEFMGMLANKPDKVYKSEPRIVRMPDGKLAKATYGHVPINKITFKCVVCNKSYPASTEGGYVSDEDTWTCPKCVTPEQIEKEKAFKASKKLMLEPGPTKISTTEAAPGFKTLILDLIDQAHYFMIAPEAIFYDRTNDPKLDLDVAPPFATCWFQFPEPSQGFTGVKIPKWSHELDAPPEMISNETDTDHDVLYGMFIHEVSAQRYLFAFVLRDNTDPNLLRFRGGFCSEGESHDVWHSIALWLQPFSSRSQVKSGVEKVNERFKYKSDGEKKLLKIKKVVYVYPKKMTKEHKDDAEKKHIDFSHRFEVRAHWRNLGPGRIGKNRAGEYCVAGKTFVMEGIKGPEHLPLIKKMRVVQDPDDES